jgi:Cap4 SAVED domain
MHNYPEKFLEVRTECVRVPPFSSLCAGYDSGLWRAGPFADHLFQWLPFVALSQENQLAFGAHNFVEMIKLAAAHIYKTKKTATRGEIGELIFHLACILHYGTSPVVCKLVLKTSSNDTVKGFDGVHILPKGDDFEIWLGESKFYSDPARGIKEAVASVKDHLIPAFLDMEKAMILGHVAEGIPNREAVKRAFKPQTSKDELLNRAVFPILIAYNSDTVTSHTVLSAQYVEELKAEAEKLRDYFAEKAAGLTVRFVLMFVPMNNKKAVIESFDKKLEAFL